MNLNPINNNRILSYVAILLFVFLPLYSAASEVEVYFSLVDDPEQQIINYLDSAEKNIDIAMYYFTDSDLSHAVVDAIERGIKIRIYLDHSQVNAKYSSSRFFVKNGIPVKISSNNDIMHNKFAVIDNKIALTGSYNWTASASERNDENLVIIKDEQIAGKYSSRFEDFWTHEIDIIKTKELYEKAGMAYDSSDNKSKSTEKTTGQSTGKENPPVEIIKVDEKDEVVTIQNNSSEGISLSGWRLVSVEGNQEFIFPDGTVLDPGETIDIISGKNAKAGPGVIIWTTANIWNNNGDPAELYDDKGELISDY
jgi:hypothetical protein